MHETAEEAMVETRQMLDVYADFCEQELAIPVIKGKKTDKEKFAGAEATYTIEAMMHDGKALQSGTSHYFGDGFSRAFGIQFTGRDNKFQYPHQTSWGMSTRIIGAIIMTHGDDNGLVLPPAVAPNQVVIIPIAQHKEGVLERCSALKEELAGAGIRVRLDDSDNSAGWKFAEYEMKGVPLRIELGPRDIEAGNCVLVSRVTGEKNIVPLENIGETVKAALQSVQDEMFKKALKNRAEHTYGADSIEEIKSVLAEKGDGFVFAPWCGCEECEDEVKAQTGVGSRCIFDGISYEGKKCVCCDKEAKFGVVWAKAY